MKTDNAEEKILLRVKALVRRAKGEKEALSNAVHSLLASARSCVSERPLLAVLMVSQAEQVNKRWLKSTLSAPVSQVKQLVFSQLSRESLNSKELTASRTNQARKYTTEKEQFDCKLRNLKKLKQQHRQACDRATQLRTQSKTRIEQRHLDIEQLARKIEEQERVFYLLDTKIKKLEDRQFWSHNYKNLLGCYLRSAACLSKTQTRNKLFNTFKRLGGFTRIYRKLLARLYKPLQQEGLVLCKLEGSKLFSLYRTKERLSLAVDLLEKGQKYKLLKLNIEKEEAVHKMLTARNLTWNILIGGSKETPRLMLLEDYLRQNEPKVRRWLTRMAACCRLRRELSQARRKNRTEYIFLRLPENRIFVDSEQDRQVFLLATRANGYVTVEELVRSWDRPRFKSRRAKYPEQLPFSSSQLESYFLFFLKSGLIIERNLNLDRTIVVKIQRFMRRKLAHLTAERLRQKIAIYYCSAKLRGTVAFVVMVKGCEWWQYDQASVEKIDLLRFSLLEKSRRRVILSQAFIERIKSQSESVFDYIFENSEGVQLGFRMLESTVYSEQEKAIRKIVDCLTRLRWASDKHSEPRLARTFKSEGQTMLLYVERTPLPNGKYVMTLESIACKGVRTCEPLRAEISKSQRDCLSACQSPESYVAVANGGLELSADLQSKEARTNYRINQCKKMFYTDKVRDRPLKSEVVFCSRSLIGEEWFTMQVVKEQKSSRFRLLSFRFWAVLLEEESQSLIVREELSSGQAYAMLDGGSAPFALEWGEGGVLVRRKF